MLSQIVRPLVQTQIRLLANSQATQATLTDTIVQWLGYLGIRVQIHSIKSEADAISVSLRVERPESCNVSDWRKILNHLHSEPKSNLEQENFKQVELAQQLQIIKLLAYLIQVGQPSEKLSWEVLKPQLISLGLDEYLLEGIHSALKVPQSLEFIERLNPDVAAQVFPLAVKIAWLDRQVNPQESDALSALLQTIS